MAKDGKEMEVVKGLNVSRYMGRWYEIASFPSSFQPKSCTDTRATYAPNLDGTIEVWNETWIDGKKVSIDGYAYKADEHSDEAKFKVTLHDPQIIVGGNYWVLYVDEGYQYALVGEPSREYLWILCRQTHMDDEIYNQLVQKAIDEGYDVKELHKTPQSDPPREGDQNPTTPEGSGGSNLHLASEDA